MSTLTVGTISEKVTDAGVAVDGVTLKDGGATFTSSISGTSVSASGTLAVTGNTTVGGTLVNTGLITASAGVAIGGTGSANTLDDYEEGTWSPTHTSGAGSGSFSNSNYTKIGKLVHVVTSFAFSSGSGTPGIGNLPFTASSAGIGIAREDQVNGYSVHIRVTSGTTTMELYGTQSTGNPSGYQTASGTHRCSLTYFTDS